MAYAAVITLKLTLQQILLHPERYCIPCENKHIESFHEKLEFLQEFLNKHPSHKSNEKATSLERRIRDAAYEAEDFMDLHLNDISGSEEMMGKIHKSNEKVTSLERRVRDAAYEEEDFMGLHLNDISGSEEMTGQINIELIMKKVDSIIEEVTENEEQMGLEIKQGRGSFKEDEIKIGEFDKDPSQLVSSDTKNLMVGFNDHLVQIKDQLTGQSSTLEVISIVGMGGIGKTTLATHVYNDPYVVNHFDIRVWVSVSQSYRKREFLLGMLDSMKILTQEMYREPYDKLKLHVYQNLKGRRYLVIIDDIWNTKDWEFLKVLFPDDETGSRIMLTTRIADVAAYTSRSGTLHQISLLTDYQSWELLRAKVFGDEPCPLSLQEIGKIIADNCGGLPLSIVVIGGLLSKVEKTQMAWQSIAENVTSFVFSSDDRCSDILRLSYNYLPQYLKACFLYMGVFPKSHEVHVSTLTKMLVAEGFLKQGDGQCPEEVAESCVEDLLHRSLILMSKNNYDGKIKAFKIHDLLLDFCVKEAKDEKFLRITKTYYDLYFQIISASERRTSIHRVEPWSYRAGAQSWSMSSTRSVICAGECHLPLRLLFRLKLLRVLDAAQVWFLKFPPQVLELLNLRYLALLYCGDIPASITKLWNLQTLIISGYSWGLCESSLPLEIWMMVHLRHVRFDRVHLLDPSAAKFNFHETHIILEDLQTLSGLLNLKFSKEMLQSIPNIKKIDVSYDAHGLQGKEWSYYQFENLGNLHNLKALKVRASPDLLGSLNLNPPSFQFPPSLKTLTLGGVGIPWHDLAIIGTLPNLEVLKLKDLACVGTEWELNEEEFLELKVLVLENLELKHWIADWNHFPNLQRLIIRRCDSLVEIPSGMGDSPTLTTIELCECNAYVSASANDILEKQQSYGNYGFQVINVDPKPQFSWHKMSAIFSLQEALLDDRT